MFGPRQLTDSERLQASIREELQAQNAIRDLRLGQEALEGLAEAVATNVEYGFDVKWAPKWVRPGDAHQWKEPDDGLPTGENHFAECLLCEWITGHNSTHEEAEQKYRRHFAEKHADAAPSRGV